MQSIMKRAGRAGDTSYCDADTHGDSCCAHAVSGPAVTSSANVAINGRGALRLGDSGVHSSCCSEGTWQATRGAPRVLINDLAAHRTTDATVHCGGSGALVSGSPNVLIGDQSRGGGKQPGKTTFEIRFLGARVKASKVWVEAVDGSIHEVDFSQGFVELDHSSCYPRAVHLTKPRR